MLELFQTEWCLASRRVRQRLTELGLDYVVRQVPVEREARALLRETMDTDVVPALRLENGSAIVGEEHILAYLGERGQWDSCAHRCVDLRTRDVLNFAGFAGVISHDQREADLTFQHLSSLGTDEGSLHGVGHFTGPHSITGCGCLVYLDPHCRDVGLLLDRQIHDAGDSAHDSVYLFC